MFIHLKVYPLIPSYPLRSKTIRCYPRTSERRAKQKTKTISGTKITQKTFNCWTWCTKVYYMLYPV